MKRFFALLLLLCLLPIPCSISVAEDKPVLVIGIVGDLKVEDYENNYLTKRLEELADVELDFMLLATSSDQFKSKLNTMLSFNTKLPDILCTEALDNTAVAHLGAQGILLPLDEYMNDAEKMPFYHLNVSADVRSLINLTTQSSDGHVYGLSKYAPWPWNACPYRMWINSRWLEKLNLDVPTTLDDFKNVLTHFVNDDPNGNGIKDEIGIMGATSGWGSNVIPFIMNAFVYANPDTNYLIVNNGQVSPAYITEEWKQGLQFMHDLTEEGLLSPWSFIQTQEQLAAFVQSPGGLVGFVPSGSYSIFNAGVALAYDEMALLPPLTGYNGQQNACYTPIIPDMNWFITKDCKDIEAAIRLGDTFYDEETSMISRYGEKGVEWDNDPEGCAQYVTRFYETQPELEVSFYSKNVRFWGSVQNKNWFDRNPRYQSLESAMGEGTIRIEDIPEPGQPLVQAKDYNPDFFNSYWPHIPNEYFSVYVYTEEEDRILSTIAPELIFFVRDTSIAFITGKRSFDTWDSYLKELDDMGLGTYLEIMQTTYDRSLRIDTQ